jgi:restriction endonuclease Mrr
VSKTSRNQVPICGIQKSVGAPHGQNAREGIFITTSGFSNGTSQYAEGLSDKVVLIDGETLAHPQVGAERLVMDCMRYGNLPVLTL